MTYQGSSTPGATCLTSLPSAKSGWHADFHEETHSSVPFTQTNLTLRAIDDGFWQFETREKSFAWIHRQCLLRHRLVVIQERAYVWAMADLRAHAVGLAEREDGTRTQYLDVFLSANGFKPLNGIYI